MNINNINKKEICLEVIERFFKCDVKYESKRHFLFTVLKRHFQ